MPTGWPASCARTHGAVGSSTGCATSSTYAGGHEAFSPFGTQRVELLDDRVFALRRGEGTADELRCITNVSGDEVSLPDVRGFDVLTDRRVDPLVLGPWQSAWLRPE